LPALLAIDAFKADRNWGKGKWGGGGTERTTFTSTTC